MAIKIYLGTVLKGHVNYFILNNIYMYHSALYVCICIYVLVRNVHIRSPNTIYVWYAMKSKFSPVSSQWLLASPHPSDTWNCYLLLILTAEQWATSVQEFTISWKESWNFCKFNSLTVYHLSFSWSMEPYHCTHHLSVLFALQKSPKIAIWENPSVVITRGILLYLSQLHSVCCSQSATTHRWEDLTSRD